MTLPPESGSDSAPSPGGKGLERGALWKELTPPDPAGISSLSPPAVAADGRTYLYSYNRILSDLFLAEGIK